MCSNKLIYSAPSACRHYISSRINCGFAIMTNYWWKTKLWRQQFLLSIFVFQQSRRLWSGWLKTLIIKDWRFCYNFLGELCAKSLDVLLKLGSCTMFGRHIWQNLPDTNSVETSLFGVSDWAQSIKLSRQFCACAFYFSVSFQAPSLAKNSLVGDFHAVVYYSSREN